MLVTCSRCGGIHARGGCPLPQGGYYRKRYARTDIQRFRSTAAWQRKRLDVLKRDKYLCRVCLDGKVSGYAITFTKLSVHHIVPIEEDERLKLDKDNLLTTCDYHHRMADKGEIDRDYLRGLAKTPPRVRTQKMAEGARPTAPPRI